MYTYIYIFTVYMYSILPTIGSNRNLSGSINMSLWTNQQVHHEEWGPFIDRWCWLCCSYQDQELMRTTSYCKAWNCVSKVWFHPLKHMTSEMFLKISSHIYKIYQLLSQNISSSVSVPRVVKKWAHPRHRATDSAKKHQSPKSPNSQFRPGYPSLARQRVQ